jgi:ATP-binding cassette subfamily C protein
VRARGGIVVVIAHRPSAIAGVDQVLVMGEGRVQSLGPKEEVLSRVLRPVPAATAEPRLPHAAPLHAASLQAASLKVVDTLGVAS